MRLRKTVWITSAIAVTLLAAIAVIFIAAASIVRSDYFRDRMMLELSSNLGGKVQFEHLAASWFPRPCIILEGSTYARAGVVEGKVARVVVCPQLLPLLKGQLRIGRVLVKDSNFTVYVKFQAKEKPFSPDVIREVILPGLAKIAKRVPGITLAMENGTLQVSRPKAEALVFSEIRGEASLSEDVLSLNLASSSSPWGRASLRGDFPFREDRLGMRGFSASAGESSLEQAEAVLEWIEDSPELKAEIGRAILDLGAVRDWGVLKRLGTAWPGNVKDLEGRVGLSSIMLEGPLLEPSKWEFSVAGDLDRVIISIDSVPPQVRLETGRFSAASSSEGASGPERSFEIIGVQGSVGKTTFGDVSGMLIQSGGPLRFRAEGEMAVLDIREIGQWPAFRQMQQGPLAWVSSVEGLAVIDKFEVQGPLKSPSRWTYSFEGSVVDLALDTSKVPYPIEISAGGISGSATPAEREFMFSGVEGNFGNSSFAGISGRMGLSGDGQRLKLSAGRMRLALKELGEWDLLRKRLGPVTSLEGVLDIDSVQFEGPAADPEQWKYALSGTARNVAVETREFPRAALNGRFSLDGQSISLDRAAFSTLDTRLNLTGTARLRQYKVESAVVNFSGPIGPTTLNWASQFQRLPDFVKIPASLQAVDARMEWKGPARASLKGAFAYPDGPRVVIDASRSPEGLAVREFLVKDSLSEASVSLKVNETAAEFVFAGSLHKKTADSFVYLEIKDDAFVSGKLTGRVPLKNPLLATAQGLINAGNIPVRMMNSPQPLIIEKIALRADQDNYLIESAAIAWGDQRFTAGGSMERAGEVLKVELNILAGSIVYENIRRMIAEMRGPAEAAQPGKPSRFWDLPIRGVIKVSADRFQIRQYASEPFSADLILGPRLIRLNLTRAFICGVPVPGNVDFTPVGTGMNFRAAVWNVDLAPVLGCFMSAEKPQITGKFDFQGEVAAHGKFPDTLSGDFTFESRRGTIYRFTLLGRILEYLNVTQILVGRVPRIGVEGLPYRYMRIKGRVEGEFIVIKEFELRGPTIGLAGEGFVDMERKRIELTVLVSPLRTLDYVIGKIPVVRYFLKGVVAIPIGVYGDYKNPIIVPLDPTAVGSQLLGILNRIIEAPAKLIESFQ